MPLSRNVKGCRILLNVIAFLSRNHAGECDADDAPHIILTARSLFGEYSETVRSAGKPLARGISLEKTDREQESASSIFRCRHEAARGRDDSGPGRRGGLKRMPGRPGRQLGRWVLDLPCLCSRCIVRCIGGRNFPIGRTSFGDGNCGVQKEGSFPALFLFRHGVRMISPIHFRNVRRDPAYGICAWGFNGKNEGIS